jgi:hypothetical protein
MSFQISICQFCNEVGSLTREHGRLLEKGSAEAVCALPLRV